MFSKITLLLAISIAATSCNKKEVANADDPKLIEFSIETETTTTISPVTTTNTVTTHKARPASKAMADVLKANQEKVPTIDVDTEPEK